jgi:putative restriction endonuclease
MTMARINQIQRAANGWDVLTKVAVEKRLISYGQLGSLIGIHHRPVRYVLGRIQEYCLHNQLPPLTILVVNQGGFRGEGFIAWDVDDIDTGLKQVYNYNWTNLENPFGYAREGLFEEDIIQELLSNPDSAQNVYAQIKVRGTAQVLFRKALLQAYNYECAFCGLSFEEALQASHIIPWSLASHAERLDIRNGILLCANHHILFDKRYLTLDEEYTIHCYDKDEHIGSYSKYDSLITTALHNKMMRLPDNWDHRPEKSFLVRHSHGF